MLGRHLNSDIDLVNHRSFQFSRLPMEMILSINIQALWWPFMAFIPTLRQFLYAVGTRLVVFVNFIHILPDKNGGELKTIDLNTISSIYWSDLIYCLVVVFCFGCEQCEVSNDSDNGYALISVKYLTKTCFSLYKDIINALFHQCLIINLPRLDVIIVNYLQDLKMRSDTLVFNLNKTLSCNSCDCIVVISRVGG